MKAVLLACFFLAFSAAVSAQNPPDSAISPKSDPSLPAEAKAAPVTPVKPPQNGLVNIEFLLDASGSMEALINGVPQMDVAKQSITATLTSIPADTPVSLRVYAHRVPKTDKEKSCQDTELMVPFSSGNAAQISQTLGQIKPNGWTPIAYSLKAAAADFAMKESRNVIILLSDGEETCGGDPVAEAKNLLAQGFKLTIHTIGFRVNELARAQLKTISDATGGLYYDAVDAASLTQNLREATQKALFIEKPSEEARGLSIRGGSQYAEAVPLTPGTEYRLDHHQKIKQYDYFSFQVKRGQIVKAKVTTQEKGISLSADGQGQENDYPYAGLRLVDEAFQEIFSAEVIDRKHGMVEKVYVPPKNQTLYLLVGSGYANMHRDSPFSISISDHFDAKTGQDAGDDILNALAIAPGEYESNWLPSNSDVDYFKLEAKAGESYDMTLTPQTMATEFRIEVYDNDRVRLAYQKGGNAGAIVRVKGVKPTQDGNLYFGVSGFLSSDPAPYSMVIAKGEAMAVAPQAPQAVSVSPSEPLPQTPTPTPSPTSVDDKGISAEVAELRQKIWLLYGVIALSWLGLTGFIYLSIKLWLKIRRLRKS